MPVLDTKDILETIQMIQDDCLDVRTTTMGISLLDCACEDMDRTCQKVYDKVCRLAKDLVRTGEEIQRQYGELLFAGFSKEDRRRLFTLLNRVAENVDAALAEEERT